MNRWAWHVKDRLSCKRSTKGGSLRASLFTLWGYEPRRGLEESETNKPPAMRVRVEGYVSTVGLNEETIRKYIREQEKHDIALDKLSVKEYEDPFTK